jgi:hypothetical protein
MKRLIPAIIIWACFLFFSCSPQRFEQEYHHGSLVFTLHDTTVIPFTGGSYLTWTQYIATGNMGGGSPENQLNDFYLSCYQFDSTTQYGSAYAFRTNFNVQQHSFNQYEPGTDHFTVELYHPIVGGIYSANQGAVNIYFNEFNSSRINGYLYGDFIWYTDTSTAYITCDFDFTP